MSYKRFLSERQKGSRVTRYVSEGSTRLPRSIYPKQACKKAPEPNVKGTRARFWYWAEFDHLRPKNCVVLKSYRPGKGMTLLVGGQTLRDMWDCVSLSKPPYGALDRIRMS